MGRKQVLEQTCNFFRTTKEKGNCGHIGEIILNIRYIVPIVRPKNMRLPNIQDTATNPIVHNHKLTNKPRECVL